MVQASGQDGDPYSQRPTRGHCGERTARDRYPGVGACFVLLVRGCDE